MRPKLFSVSFLVYYTYHRVQAEKRTFHMLLGIFEDFLGIITRQKLEKGKYEPSFIRKKRPLKGFLCKFLANIDRVNKAF